MAGADDCFVSFEDPARLPLCGEDNTSTGGEGEEALAPILIHLLAPLGTVVLYGQPSAGVVLRVTDESTKARCRALLNTFETR